MQGAGRIAPPMAAGMAGVGILFVEGIDDTEAITVFTLLSGGPADRDGTIQVGDVITHVDQKSVEKKPLESVRSCILGAPGTVVDLQFRRQGVEHPIMVTLPRERDASEEISVRLTLTERELDVCTRDLHRTRDELDREREDRINLDKQLHQRSEETALLRRQLDQAKMEIDMLRDKNAQLQNELSDARRVGGTTTTTTTKVYTPEVVSVSSPTPSLLSNSNIISNNTTRLGSPRAVIISAAAAASSHVTNPATVTSSNIISSNNQNSNNNNNGSIVSSSPVMIVSSPIIQQQQPLSSSSQVVYASPTIITHHPSANITNVPTAVTYAREVVGSPDDEADVGIVLGDDPLMQEFPVIQVIPGGAADKSGVVCVGDALVGVDIYSVKDRPVSLVREFIRGRAGSPVTLYFRRANNARNMMGAPVGDVYQVTLTRGYDARSIPIQSPTFANAPFYGINQQSRIIGGPADSASFGRILHHEPISSASFRPGVVGGGMIHMYR